MQQATRTNGVAVAIFIGAIAAMSGIGVLPASAQTNDEVYETCSLYNTIIATGGDRAVDAIADLRTRDEPNPPGIDEAFDVLSSAEDETADDPDLTDIDVANDNLAAYYGPICNDIDTCALLSLINGANDTRSRQAAGWLDGISAPSPPGIGAALAVLSGEIDPSETSGLVEDETAARDTINDWFGANCQLAITGGSDTFALTMIGAGALIVGGTLHLVRRRELGQ